MQQTGCAELERAKNQSRQLYDQNPLRTHQLVPLTPMTEMGEHVTPTWPVTLPTTTPRRPRRVATEGVFADWTELQHCAVPTLHWSTEGVGVATARRGTSARAASLLKNIVKKRD